jgi:Domain of unknown function (DUF5011)
LLGRDAGRADAELVVGGFYTLNYAGFTPYIIKAIQQLAQQLTDLANTVAGFAQSFVSDNITAASSSTDSSATPPVLQLNGDNPAIIQVGATYADLGATITGPTADLNLGIKTFLNGTEMSPVVIDTSSVATDTIQYVATNQNGLTATSTRTVIIQAANDNTPPLASTTTTASSTQ